MKHATRCLLYARCSTSEQRPEPQLEELRADARCDERRRQRDDLENVIARYRRELRDSWLRGSPRHHVDALLASIQHAQQELVRLGR